MSVDTPNPFGQTNGKIQVWTRTDPGKGQSKSTIQNPKWTYSHVSDMANPFGGRINGVHVYSGFRTRGYNSFTEVDHTGDEFGSYMQSTVNSENGRYILAVGCNVSLTPDQGRCVCLFEELKTQVYAPVGVLFLPEKHDIFTFSNDDRNSFGTCFDIVNDTCLASFGSHTGNRRIAHFRRFGTPPAWSFLDVIEPPSLPTGVGPELFATSIVMANYEGVAIVGSPAASSTHSTLPTLTRGPVGGSLYVYVRSGDGVWEVVQTVNSPFASTKFSNTGTFGWFVNTDINFRLVSVSTNQNSVYQSYPKRNTPSNSACEWSKGQDQLSPCDYSAIVLLAFDQGRNRLVTSDAIRVFQRQLTNFDPVQYIDPLFGALVSISIPDKDSFDSITRICVGSPLSESTLILHMG
jgi:hypothetical protein